MHKFLKKNMRNQDGHWDEFNVTKLVSHWFRKPERNLGLIVEVMYKGQNLAVMPRMADHDRHVSFFSIFDSTSCIFIRLYEMYIYQFHRDI